VKITANHLTREILDRMSLAERKALTDGLYLAAGDLMGDPPNKPETIAIIDHGLASILPEWVVKEIETTRSTSSGQAKHTKYTKGK
jgi:hypothetical protein